MLVSYYLSFFKRSCNEKKQQQNPNYTIQVCTCLKWATMGSYNCDLCPHLHPAVCHCFPEVLLWLLGAFVILKHPSVQKDSTRNSTEYGKALSDLLVQTTRNSSRYFVRIPGCGALSWCFSSGACASVRKGRACGITAQENAVPFSFLLWWWKCFIFSDSEPFHKQSPHKFPLYFWCILGVLELFSVHLLGCLCIAKENPWSSPEVLPMEHSRRDLYFPLRLQEHLVDLCFVTYVSSGRCSPLWVPLAS